MLSNETTDEVTVAYATSGGSATAGSDYTAASGTLTFAPGETSQSFSVAVLEDGDDEPNETVILALNDPVNATLGTPSEATLTIVDNDQTGTLPAVQFGSATYSVNEGGGSATINVTLSNAATGVVTVAYATSDGTATAGDDYTAASGTLTFQPGETSQSFTVDVTYDTVADEDETVNLALSSPANATLGTPANAVLTIIAPKSLLPLVHQ
jgi:hypothetical protein